MLTSPWRQHPIHRRPAAREITRRAHMRAAIGQQATMRCVPMRAGVGGPAWTRGRLPLAATQWRAHPRGHAVIPLSHHGVLRVSAWGPHAGGGRVVDMARQERPTQRQLAGSPRLAQFARDLFFSSPVQWSRGQLKHLGCGFILVLDAHHL
jgi:hypothetical protein